MYCSVVNFKRRETYGRNNAPWPSCVALTMTKTLATPLKHVAAQAALHLLQ